MGLGSQALARDGFPGICGRRICPYGFACLRPSGKPGCALRWLENLREYRVQAYKTASLARTRDDLGVLVRLLLDHPKLRTGLMALGLQAEILCLVLPSLGSKMVYGYLDAPAAKAQPSVKESPPNFPGWFKAPSFSAHSEVCQASPFQAGGNQDRAPYSDSHATRRWKTSMPCLNFHGEHSIRRMAISRVLTCLCLWVVDWWAKGMVRNWCLWSEPGLEDLLSR